MSVQPEGAATPENRPESAAKGAERRVRYAAKDISTEDFVQALIRAHANEGYASSHGIHRVLAESRPELPFKVTLAKLATLDRQGIVEGCPCGCSSPAWVVVPRGTERTAEWQIWSHLHP